MTKRTVGPTLFSGSKNWKGPSRSWVCHEAGVLLQDNGVDLTDPLDELITTVWEDYFDIVVPIHGARL